MATFCFQAAGVDICLRGSSYSLPILRQLFAGFPAAGLEHQVEITWSEKECKTRLEGKASRTIRIKSQDLIPQITTFLLAQVLQEIKPELAILHGNALLRGDGRMLFLIGDSGSGKTTLTREIARLDAEWRQVSEDYLLIHSGVCPCLFPFPRAAALLSGRSGKEGSWRRIGTTEQKVLSAVKAPSGAIPLKEVDVVILQKKSMGREPKAFPGEATWASLVPPEAMDILRAKGFPAPEVIEHPDMDCIRHYKKLSEQEKALLFQTLEASGAMILQHGGLFSTKSRGSFLPSPAAEAMSFSNGINACLGHLRRYASKEPQAPAGMAFMRLASIFRNARFSLLLPGGTPWQTAGLLQDMIATAKENPHEDTKVQAPHSYQCINALKEGH